MTGLAILIEVAEFDKRGSDLFSVKDQFMEEGDDDNEKWPFLCPEPHLERKVYIIWVMERFQVVLP
jgi:hypothetical protein